MMTAKQKKRNQFLREKYREYAKEVKRLEKVRGEKSYYGKRSFTFFKNYYENTASPKSHLSKSKELANRDFYYSRWTRSEAKRAYKAYQQKAQEYGYDEDEYTNWKDFQANASWEDLHDLYDDEIRDFYKKARANGMDTKTIAKMIGQQFYGSK